jgi:hypothetical protein
LRDGNEAGAEQRDDQRRHRDAVIVMPVCSPVSDAAGRRRVFVWPFLVLAGLAFDGSEPCTGRTSR